jgi:hypothetical protein
MSLTEAWNAWKEWLLSLSPEFAFLLAIPFAVAAAGLLKFWINGSGSAWRGAERREPRANREKPRAPA